MGPLHRGATSSQGEPPCCSYSCISLALLRVFPCRSCKSVPQGDNRPLCLCTRVLRPLKRSVPHMQQNMVVREPICLHHAELIASISPRPCINVCPAGGAEGSCKKSAIPHDVATARVSHRPLTSPCHTGGAEARPRGGGRPRHRRGWAAQEAHPHRLPCQPVDHCLQQGHAHETEVRLQDTGCLV